MKVLSRAAPVQYLVWKLCVVLSLCLEFVNRKRREIQDFPGILLMAGNNSSSRLSSGHSFLQVLMWMAGDILRWNGSGQYIQGVFFNWCSPKIHKYGEKLMYQNWCPPKIHKYGENCPPKSAIGIPLRYQPPQSVLQRWGLVHWTTIATYSSTLKWFY